MSKATSTSMVELGLAPTPLASTMSTFFPCRPFNGLNGGLQCHPLVIHTIHFPAMSLTTLKCSLSAVRFPHQPTQIFVMHLVGPPLLALKIFAKMKKDVWGTHNLDLCNKPSNVSQWQLFNPNLTEYTVPSEIVDIVGGRYVFSDCYLL